MTPEEGIARAQEILPEKILVQHVGEDKEVLGAVYGVIGVLIFAKANGLKLDLKEVFG